MESFRLHNCVYSEDTKFFISLAFNQLFWVFECGDLYKKIFWIAFSHYVEVIVRTQKKAYLLISWEGYFLTCQDDLNPQFSRSTLHIMDLTRRAAHFQRIDLSLACALVYIYIYTSSSDLSTQKGSLILRGL